MDVSPILSPTFFDTLGRGVAEHKPRGQDKERIDEQCRPAFLGVYPFDYLVYRLVIEGKRHDIFMQMKDRLENESGGTVLLIIFYKNRTKDGLSFAT